MPRSELRGTLQNDVLKEFVARKEWVIPPGPSLDLVTDTVEFAVEETPNVYPVSVSGYHIREAGSTAVQELAFTLADGFAHAEAARERGPDGDTVARGSPTSSTRARLGVRGGGEAPRRPPCVRPAHGRLVRRGVGRGPPAEFPTRTASQSLTAQQPLTNVVRVTLQALAGVLGGTQSLHTNPLDEALALPGERVALRTQQVIAEESGGEVVVGVNRYTVDDDPGTELHRVDEAAEERQRDRLVAVKAERDDRAVAAALSALAAAVADGGNAMPFLIDAVKAYATVGEVMDAFESEFGAYSEPVGLAG